jgi:hypothetical protein
MSKCRTHKQSSRQPAVQSTTAVKHAAALSAMAVTYVYTSLTKTCLARSHVEGTSAKCCWRCPQSLIRGRCMMLIALHNVMMQLSARLQLCTCLMSRYTHPASALGRAPFTASQLYVLLLFVL